MVSLLFVVESVDAWDPQISACPNGLAAVSPAEQLAPPQMVPVRF
jgi:hypothetical protein